MPIYSNDADSSVEFATSIEIRGPPAQAQAAYANQIVFVDSALKQEFQFKNASNLGVLVGVLPANTNGIQYITDILSSFRAISAIHIISHGAPGQVSLGSAELTVASLENHTDQLRNWALALTADADILIYGCSVAQSDEGQALVDRIAELTGADVAASSDPTGNVGLGGDWVLEAQTEIIEASIPFSREVLDGFTSLLAILEVRVSSISDDAEESSSGIVRPNGSDLELVSESSSDSHYDDISINSVSANITDN